MMINTPIATNNPNKRMIANAGLILFVDIKYEYKSRIFVPNDMVNDRSCPRGPKGEFRKGIGWVSRCVQSNKIFS